MQKSGSGARLMPATAAQELLSAVKAAKGGTARDLEESQ